MRIAIIGAGPSGLACAWECENLGVVADVFERTHSVGWTWPSVTLNINFLSRNLNIGGDPIIYLKTKYGLTIKPISEVKKIIMKSQNKKVEITGSLGYSFIKGKGVLSVENGLKSSLWKSVIHFSRPADYQELSKKYDYVVVATGKDTEASELGVWEDCGQVSMIGGIGLGNFDPETQSVFFDTEYAGTGYGRVSPFSPTEAIIALYFIGHGPYELEKKFSTFLRKERLEHIEMLHNIKPPVFNTGKVKKFQVGNILLVGRAAGLTERLLGLGGEFAIESGILAARAIIKGLDYESLIKPIKDHIENISAFRNIIDNFTNDDFDKALALIGTPGIKQLLYNTPLNFTDPAGFILKKIYGEQPHINQN